MPSRSPPSNRKRKKPPIPPMVGGGKRAFGNSLAHGLQIERRFRRMFPLTEADVKQIHRGVTATLKGNSKGYDWFFVSFYLSIKGAVYQAGWKLLDATDDEDEKWTHSWVSTPVAASIKALHQVIDDTLLTRLDRMLRGRPAWLLRFRVVFIKNEPSRKKPT